MSTKGLSHRSYRWKLPSSDFCPAKGVETVSAGASALFSARGLRACVLSVLNSSFPVHVSVLQHSAAAHLPSGYRFRPLRAYFPRGVPMRATDAGSLAAVDRRSEERRVSFGCDLGILSLARQRQ